MKFSSRIAIYSIVIIAGISLIVSKTYNQLPYKSIVTSTYTSASSSFKIGYFIGHFMFIILGALLIMAGITGLICTFKKNKNKGEYN